MSLGKNIIAPIVAMVLSVCLIMESIMVLKMSAMTTEAIQIAGAYKELLEKAQVRFDTCNTHLRRMIRSPDTGQ